MNRVQIDSDYFGDKVKLRIDHLPCQSPLLVLDAFGADSAIWNEVIETTKRQIQIARIEIKKNKKGAYLQGNNLKYLKNMDLNQYDIIDLDSYGIPYAQMEMVFDFAKKKLLECTVFVTAIQSQFGMLPRNMIYDLGYSKDMVRKIPTIFNRNGFDKILQYLSTRGVREIFHRGTSRKHYFCFKISRKKTHI